MANSPSSNGDHVDWPALFRAAISETDRTILGTKVSQAENAIRSRAHELARQDGTADLVEQEALDDALYVLRGIKSTARQAA